jgi:hypothetical protein
MPADLRLHLVARCPDIVAARLRARAAVKRIDDALAEFFPTDRSLSSQASGHKTRAKARDASSACHLRRDLAAGVSKSLVSDLPRAVDSGDREEVDKRGASSCGLQPRPLRSVPRLGGRERTRVEPIRTLA